MVLYAMYVCKHTHRENLETFGSLLGRFETIGKRLNAFRVLGERMGTFGRLGRPGRLVNRIPYGMYVW